MSRTSHAAAQTAHKMLLSSLYSCRKRFDIMPFGVRKRDRDRKQNVGELFFLPVENNKMSRRYENSN